MINAGADGKTSNAGCLRTNHLQNPVLCDSLQALVHISTGYAHVDKGRYDVATIEEKVYDPPITPEQAISMIR